MTTDRDLERLLDTWFVDAAIPVPDRAFEAAVERVYRQSQRPAWRFLNGRFPTVSTTLKLVLTAGVLLAVVLGGSILMSGGGGPGPAPSPSPTATPTPTPTPSPTAVVDLGTTGMQVQGETISWRVVIPSGWTGDGGSRLTASQGYEPPTGATIGASGAVNVPSDPCDGLGKFSEAAAPADVAAELQARDDLVVSDPIDTTLGGYPAVLVDVEFPADLSACADFSYLFAEPDGSGMPALGPSNLFRVWIVDVEGRPVVFWISSFAETPAADLAAAQGIMESIVITP